MKKNIALVAGGYSGEYVISVQSAAVIEAQLDHNRYNVYKIVITRDSWTYTGADGQAVAIDRNDFSLTLKGEKIKFDFGFLEADES